ncbi:MAG: PCMD domain-containing protein [Mucinivorans sp.]
MKRTILYRLMLAVLLLTAVGCARDNRSAVGGEQGVVLFSVQTDMTANVASRAGETTPPTPETPAIIYRLTILKGETVVGTYPDISKITDLTLPVGAYKFVAESGVEATTAIDAPYYRGEKDVTIVGGQTTAVTITAKLANVRISAVVSQTIKDNFKDYSLTVDAVTLTKNDIIANKSLYVSATPGKFTWILNVVNNQDVASISTAEVTGVLPCTHYKFSFDVDKSANENQGQLVLNLTVNTAVTSTEETINLNLEKKEVPKITELGGKILTTSTVIVDVVKREADFRLSVLAQAKLRAVTLSHNNAWLTARGVPATFDILTLSSGAAATINAAGITWRDMTLGGLSSSLDFTGLAKNAEQGEYNITIAITDQMGQVTNATVRFSILPDQDHITHDAVSGAKYAVLNGVWCTTAAPIGLTFQYQENGASTWTSVPAAQIQKVEATKSFSATIRGLRANTPYNFRTYSSSAPGSEKVGIQKSFTTEFAPEIPNLNFEQQYWSGKTWYPNATGGNSYWATGNEGVNMSPVNKPSNNTDFNDSANGHPTAVKLSSIGNVLMVGFAGGSIFTGDYKTNMGSPASSVKFGRAYDGRPLALKGWYKYTGGAINVNSYVKVPGVNGTADKCHIYISLEKWGSATARPSSPNVIGYGELKSADGVPNWTQFNIPIQYNSTDKPDHVVLVATASYLGGDFCGCSSSVLCIDDFELVWEPEL